MYRKIAIFLLEQINCQVPLLTNILKVIYMCNILHVVGADPGFQVRGRGALKKIAPSGGMRENCGGILCEKSRFYAKKSYFFQF